MFYNFLSKNYYILVVIISFLIAGKAAYAEEQTRVVNENSLTVNQIAPQTVPQIVQRIEFKGANIFTYEKDFKPVNYHPNEATDNHLNEANLNA